ncbi:MAG: HK97 gp10 family phage protein [Clostridia bacterium]|nr:HK97 gp10 family phage protein [Clostridia bacterium]
MASRKVKINDFETVLKDILDDYKDNVTERTKRAVVQVAKIAQQETKAGANVRTGKYRSGWAVKEDAVSRLRTEAIVYNRSRYQLAHLLEKGHALRGGGRVKAFPHIEPAEQHALKNMEEAVKKIAEG